MRKFSLAAFFLYCLWASTQVLAHGAIARTLPADSSEVTSPPTQVQVWFNEALQPGTGAIQVITSTGERVEQGATRHNEADATLLEVDLRPDLPAGAYIISASGVVVSDGHTATGSTLFWIGAANQRPAPDYEILATAIAVLLCLGAVGYWLVLRRPAIDLVMNTAPADHHFPLE